MEEDLRAAIGKIASERVEAGRLVKCLSLEATEGLTREFDITPREVSIFALEHGFVPLRYIKNIGTLGPGGQARLLKSRVVVVGAGGIGGHAAELLARMGVGTVLLVDPDVFDETNLNRQKFATEATLGLNKVDVAGDMLGEINRDVEVVRHRIAACAENLPDLIAGADVVIDALDSLDDRLTLQQACREQGVVMIHGAIAGTFLQVMTVYPGDPGLSQLLTRAIGEEKARGIETETGNPATTPALAAAIQVQEAIKVITGRGTALRGKMLYLDVDDWSVEFIELEEEE